MAHFYALLTVATGFIVSSTATGISFMESRDTCATFPFTGPASIVTAVQSIGLFEDISPIITIQSLVENTLAMNFDVQNPLPVELTLDSVAATAGLNGTTFATFTHSFPSPGLIVPALGTTSGTIDNVALPQGAAGLLAIIPFGILDLSNIDASSRILTSAGSGGISIPLNGLTQTSFPVKYSIASCAPS